MENESNSNNNSHWNREYQHLARMQNMCQQLITTQQEQDGDDRHWTSPNNDSHVANQHGNATSFLPRDVVLGKLTLSLKRDKIRPRLPVLLMTYIGSRIHALYLCQIKDLG